MMSLGTVGRKSTSKQNVLKSRLWPWMQNTVSWSFFKDTW